MSLIKVSWIWVRIPTQKYVQENELKGTNFEDLLEEVMNKCPINGPETVQLTQDGNAKTLQFCVHEEASRAYFSGSYDLFIKNMIKNMFKVHTRATQFSIYMMLTIFWPH